jgi:hypothetical protein
LKIRTYDSGTIIRIDTWYLKNEEGNCLESESLISPMLYFRDHQFNRMIVVTEKLKSEDSENIKLSDSLRINMRVYPKVSGLAAWLENCKWYSSLPLSAVVSLFCESV